MSPQIETLNILHKIVDKALKKHCKKSFDYIYTGLEAFNYDSTRAVIVRHSDLSIHASSTTEYQYHVMCLKCKKGKWTLYQHRIHEGHCTRKTTCMGAEAMGDAWLFLNTEDKS